jgi:filamentous hemagglutinin family protein
MLYQITEKLPLISGALLASITLAIPVNAQPITPAADGTDTQVNQQGNTINITGGQTSVDGGNLFHSFDEFGVNTGETANFQSSPEINNILGRVVGGNASIINGILQVTGGNSNLFLMNPAGILFGPNASLNVPADFTATTATSIGFGDNNWFNSVGDNNWADLVGTPSLFAFDVTQPGWVVNFADLTLDAGQNLTLLGGGVITEGNLTAPGGNISIAAVPGESIVRISQPGNILSLDISTPADNSGLNPTTINPLSLPQLLTGGDAVLDATQVQHNADGTITLTSPGVTIDPTTDTGLALVSGEIAAETNGQVNVLAHGGNIILDQVHGDTVKVNANGGNITQVDSDSLINASAVELQTEGEGGIGLETEEWWGIVETEPLRLEADNLEATAGSGGAFLEVPNGDVTVGGVTDELTGMSIDGGNLSLEAAGNITVSEDISTSGATGGNITLTSTGGAIDTTGGDISASSQEDGFVVTLNAAGDIYTGDISTTNNSTDDFSWWDIFSFGATSGNITINSGGAIDTTGGVLNTSSESGDAGWVELSAEGDIRTGDIFSYGATGGDITLDSGGAIDTTGGTIDTWSEEGDAASVTLTAADDIYTGDISTTNDSTDAFSWGEIFSSGGDITLNSGGAIDTTGGELNTSSESGDAGDVSLTAEGDIRTGDITSFGETGGDISLSSGGAIDTTGGTIDTWSESGDGSWVTLTAAGDIYTGDISTTNDSTDAFSWGEIFSSGGDITLNSGGAIDTTGGELNTSSESGDAGDVSLTAEGDIRTGDITSFGETGGDITLDSGGAIDTTGGELNTSSESGDAGDVSLTAEGDIRTGFIQSWSFADSSQGGDITIISRNGAIDTTIGDLSGEAEISPDEDISNNASIFGERLANLDAYSSEGKGGNVTLEAAEDITTSHISTFGPEGSGDINITSHNGTINTGVIFSVADGTGSAGDVTLSAGNNINTSHISAWANQQGGNITIDAGGSFEIGEATIQSFSQEANAGDVKITASNDITLGGDETRDGISSTGPTQGGDITLTSTGGAIDATDGALNSYSENGNAGSVNLTAANDIQTNSIGSYSGGNGVAGRIYLESTNGEIDTSMGQLDSTSEAGSGGHIELEASGDIRTGFVSSYSASDSADSYAGSIWMTSHNGSIDTTVGNLSGEAQISPSDDVSSEEAASIFNNAQANLESYAGGGTGGNVILKADGDITTSHISTFGPQGSGNVSITSNNGAINSGGIFSFSQAGNAGNVNLNAANNISTSHISAWGDLRGGNITIDAGNVGDRLKNDVFCECVNLIESGGNFEIGSATIHSFSQAGNAGDVQISTRGDTNLGGDANRHAIRSAGSQHGGNISIFSVGNINTIGDIETFSDIGIGGNVSLAANGSVIIGNLRTYGPIQSGDIVILSCKNSVQTASLETVAPNGTSGNITINTFGIEGNIQTIELVSAGEEGSGNITVKAEDGSVTTENITSIATDGDSGDITVDGEDDVETGDITSDGDDDSGDISVNSDEGSVTTGDVTTTADNGDSGDVTIAAKDDVTTDNITSQAGNNSGDISVSSESGSVTTGDVTTIADNGDSGDVTVTAQNDVQTGNIASTAGQNSGNISLISDEGAVITGNIETIAENGSSGNITLRANNDVQALNITSIGEIDSGNISVTSETGNITTANLETVAETGNSGDVDLTASQDITTEDIRSIAGTNSGDISATSTEGAISSGDIETRAITGSSGDINLNAQEDINTGNITSIGAIESGDITLNSAEGVVNTGELFTDTGEITINQSGQGNSDPNSSVTSASILSSHPNSQTFNSVLTSTHESTEGSISNNSQPDVQQVLGNIQVSTSNTLPSPVEDQMTTLEESRSSEFAESLGLSFEEQIVTTASARDVLGSIAEQTGTESAVVYVTSYEDQLELIIFTADGAPIRAAVPEANRQALMKEVQDFRAAISDPRERVKNSYFAPAQQLYQWLIAPIEAELEAANIDTLLFSMDAGLRSLPIAALHDGQQFLVEKYSLSFIPSVSLMDGNYQPLQGTEVLAMGADTFPDMNDLSGVSVELDLITEQIWPGTKLLNQDFTRENLQQQRQNHRYDIVHLATHADFNSDDENSSFIYFWNDKLSLDDLRDLGLNNPAAELLVLSACRTAVGDEIAELGFAGLAVRSGVKSVLASLWYVSDEGTLALMTEFYQALNSATIKSEALRQAQIAMIHNQVQISSNQLESSKQNNASTLPPALARLQSMDLSHPYYWSAFTMIGSPW